MFGTATVGTATTAGELFLSRVLRWRQIFLSNRSVAATLLRLSTGTPGGKEPGYSQEVFDVLGNTVAVVTVRELQIEPLTSNELLHVCSATPCSTIAPEDESHEDSCT